MQDYQWSYRLAGVTEPAKLSISFSNVVSEDTGYVYDSDQYDQATGAAAPHLLWQSANQRAHFIAQMYGTIFMDNNVVFTDCVVTDVDDITLGVLNQFVVPIGGLSWAETTPVRGVSDQVAGLYGRLQAPRKPFRPYAVRYLSDALSLVNDRRPINTLGTTSQNQLALLIDWMTYGGATLKTVSRAKDVPPRVVGVTLNKLVLYHAQKRG